MRSHHHTGGSRANEKSLSPGTLPNHDYVNISLGTQGLDINVMSPPVIQIPASLVVTASAFREFMRKNRLDEVVEGLLMGVDVKHIESVVGPAAQIQEIIGSSPLPETVCDPILEGCREMGYGATVVWPVTMPLELFHCSNQYQRFPYQQATGPEETVQAIRRWWASLFDPSAIFYRELNGQRHRDARITVAAQRVSDSKPNGFPNPLLHLSD